MHSFRLLADLPWDRCPARLGPGARSVAVISAACAGRVVLIWPARAGCRSERGEAQEGFALLEVAVPSWLEDRHRSEQEDWMGQVVIGMDPDKRSAAIEIMAADEGVAGGGR
jgi:hypothetical protein